MSKITGKCLCGAVSYSTDAEPLRMAQCHCKACQRASGTGHMSLAFFKEEQVSINGDFTEHAAIADSGNENIRGFCNACGSRLFSRNSGRPGVIAITAGSADDNSWFSPQAIVYNKDKPSWDCMDGELTTFDAMPPPPPK